MSTQPSPTAGMTLAQRILHVGGRNNAAGYVEFGSTQAVEALVRHVLRDLPAQPRAVPTKQQLTDMLAQLLSGTYHCTRVWAAWGVGAMSEDDFEDVGESDKPAELADAVLAEFEAAGYSEAPTQQAQAVPTEVLPGWKFNHAQEVDSDGIWALGWRDPEDGEFAPFVEVDTGEYYQPKDAEPLARAILARLISAPAPQADPQPPEPVPVSGLLHEFDQLLQQAERAERYLASTPLPVASDVYSALSHACDQARRFMAEALSSQAPAVEAAPQQAQGVQEDVKRAQIIEKAAQSFKNDTTHLGQRVYVNDLVWALGVLAAAHLAAVQQAEPPREEPDLAHPQYCAGWNDAMNSMTKAMLRPSGIGTKGAK